MATRARRNGSGSGTKQGTKRTGARKAAGAKTPARKRSAKSRVGAGAGKGGTSTRKGRTVARKGAAARKGARGAKASSRRGTARAPARRRAARPNAIAMLKEDHARVQAMFDRFEGMRDGPQKENLVRRILEELRLHTAAEEEIFYPAVREALGEKASDLVDEAEVEHDSAKKLMAEIEGASMGDDRYDARVTVLGEYVKHHVKEEQNEMFPRARQAGIDLRALGEAIAARKARGPGEGREPGLLESAVRTLMPGE